jgi:hypothetical protein
MAGSTPTGSPVLSEADEAGATEACEFRTSGVDGAGAGSISCKKVKRIWSGLGSRKRKVSLIKNNVARDDDLASGKIKTPVALLRRRVTEEDTRC